MWFKQVKAFALSSEFMKDSEQLEDKLRNFQFKPCLPSFSSSHGWLAPIGDGDDAPLYHTANNYYLLCMQMEEKILPASVINKQLEEKAKQVRKEQDRKLSRKEKQDLKENIYRALLPQAFSKLSQFYFMLDIKQGYLYVDNTSANKLEKCLSLFKKTFGDDAYHHIDVKKPTTILTHWLSSQDYPSVFAVEDQCVLKDPRQQTRLVRLQKQDLSHSLIQTLLKEGLEVSQLLLSWDEKMSFVLTDDFSIKSVKYHGSLLDLAKDQYSETPEQQFDADFFIMSESLSQMMEDLFSVFLK